MLKPFIQCVQEKNLTSDTKLTSFTIQNFLLLNFPVDKMIKITPL